MIRLKSTLLALSLLTASSVFAQTNITGDWDVTVTRRRAPTDAVTFKQDGAKVSGMFKSPQGTLPFENGSVTGDDLKFTFTINAQGMELPITLTARSRATPSPQGRLRRLRRRGLERKALGGDHDLLERDDDHNDDDHNEHDTSHRHRLRRQVGRDAEDAAGDMPANAS